MSPKKRFSIKNPFARHGRQTSGTAPVDTMPPELLQRTATYLSHHDRFVAALVSRAWRAILLAHPLLWATVSLCPRTPGDMRFVADVLHELFQRSQRLPLTVELSLKAADDDADEKLYDKYIDSPRGAFRRAIPLALVPQMGRVRSLSLQIHEWSKTRWADVLRAPAPRLETFRLAISSSEDAEPLPDDLFGNHAPRLRAVLLDYAVFPANPGPALAGVASFFYDHGHNLEEDQLRHIASWRNLRDLTVAADDYISPTPFAHHLRGARLRRLQLWPFCDAQTVLNTFPDVQHICLSARLENRPQLPTNPQLLVSAIRAKAAVTQSVEIGYREELLPELLSHDKAELAAANAGDGPLFAVRLDGHDAVVDLQFVELGRVLLTLPVESLFRSLRRLAVPEPLFPLFDVANLPPLEVLTLYLGPLPANIPRPAPIMERRAHRVTILRVVRVLPAPEDRRPPSLTPPHSISSFLQAKLVPGVLRRIVLEGYTVATQQEYNMLRGFAPEVFFMPGGSGWLEDDDCGPWKWWFPTADALRI